MKAIGQKIAPLIIFLKPFFLTLLHLSPLRFHCVGGCLDCTQDCCDFGIGSDALTTRLDLLITIRWLDLIPLIISHHLRHRHNQEKGNRSGSDP
jgi:hypothetical protein